MHLAYQYLMRVVYCCCLVAKSYLTLLRPHGLKQPARLLCPWDFPGENTGVGSRSLLQGSSQSRDQTQVFHIVG